MYPSELNLRGSLSLQVEVASSFEEKLKRLVPILESRTGPAIVYVTLQKQAEEIAQKLSEEDIETFVYHAGLPAEQREEVQVKFMESEKGVVCATVAFGMGIDKGKVRLYTEKSSLTVVPQPIFDRSESRLRRSTVS